MSLAERLEILKGTGDTRGSFVVYWMQAAVRVADNPALLHARQQASERRLPLLVVFCLDPHFPQANLRNLTFLWQGLEEVRQELKSLGLGFWILKGSPPKVLPGLVRRADLVVMDLGYTRIQRLWRTELSRTLNTEVHQVETEALIPLRRVSQAREYSAATLRRKYLPLLPFYAAPLPVPGDLRSRFIDWTPDLSPDIPLYEGALDVGPSLRAFYGDSLNLLSPAPVRGGCRQALERWNTFRSTRLERYHLDRNDPSLGATSGLSPYLHFGHIGPQTLVQDLRLLRGEGKDAFLEEVLIRRELAMNYCWYTPEYDRYHSLPNWALQTLSQHAQDPRPGAYSLEVLHQGRTEDQAWNAAQRELIHLGTMAGYMRMYWGKKLLEWIPDPQKAFETAVAWNDTYQLDGRDPNGYAGVAWCFGLHDRPWGERAVFGLVRSMTYSGLKRKFNVESYCRSVEERTLGPQGFALSG